MKKVKIMLLSLALLAVVGGAVAFRVKSNSFYCTTQTINGTCGLPLTTCPVVGNSTFDQQNQQPFVCYTTRGTYVTHSVAGEEIIEDGCFTNVGLTENHVTTTITCLAATTRLKQGD